MCRSCARTHFTSYSCGNDGLDPFRRSGGRPAARTAGRLDRPTCPVRRRARPTSHPPSAGESTTHGQRAWHRLPAEACGRRASKGRTCAPRSARRPANTSTPAPPGPSNARAAPPPTTRGRAIVERGPQAAALEARRGAARHSPCGGRREAQPPASSPTSPRHAEHKASRCHRACRSIVAPRPRFSSRSGVTGNVPDREIHRCGTDGSGIREKISAVVVWPPATDRSIVRAAARSEGMTACFMPRRRSQVEWRRQGAAGPRPEG